MSPEEQRYYEAHKAFVAARQALFEATLAAFPTDTHLEVTRNGVTFKCWVRFPHVGKQDMGRVQAYRTDIGQPVNVYPGEQKVRIIGRLPRVRR